MIKFTHC